MEILKHITETIEGYEVKDLRWLPLDNIIVGLVKPPYNNPKVHNGFESCAWKKNGYPTNRNKGRKDLILKMNYEKG
jgi:hypothetical protein